MNVHDAALEVFKAVEGQEWRRLPGDDVISGLITGERLEKFGVVQSRYDLAEMPIGTVLKTGVSAYERVA